jgi:hypothetical protein
VGQEARARQDVITLGSASVGEPRAHVGQPDADDTASAACRRCLTRRRQTCGEASPGAGFAITACPHDVGTDDEEECTHAR